MAQWTKTDEADGSPIWAPALVNQAPTRANANEMFGNTTADALVTDETIGTFGVGDLEMNLAAAYRLQGATINAYGSAYLPGDTLTIANTGDANTITEATVDINAIEVATIALNGVGTGGSYVPGSQLRVANGVSTINAWANITSTEVRTVAVNEGGTGYANGDTLRPSTGTQSTNAIFTVTTGAADTIIASLVLTGRGVFTTNPTLLANCPLTVITGTGTDGTVDLTMRVLALGAISTGNRGRFTTIPTLTAATTNTSSGNGTGATVNVTMRIREADLEVTEDGLYKTQPELAENAATGGTGTGVTLVLAMPATESPAKGAGMTGWILRKEGTGGRAGRVQMEVLVASSSMTGDGSDDALLPP